MATQTGSGAQRPSHTALAQEPTGDLPGDGTPLEAIVVPASRGAAALSGAVALACGLDVPLVALCSKNTCWDEVIALAPAKGVCQTLAVDVPVGYRLDALPTATSAPQFRQASAGRRSDLSTKRNLGLLLARLLGWRKILFLDDDARLAPPNAPLAASRATAQSIATQLDRFQVAGPVCREFPDNSVVCHARRAAGLPQDNFVTGATLGVNCSDQPLPFFPDIYNEDWFFFSRLAAQRNLARVGTAYQTPYDPYACLTRARHEEFGDLLAEGLFALFEDQDPELDYRLRLRQADASYWARFIEARADMLAQTAERLATPALAPPDAAASDSGGSEQRHRALRSLTAARAQLGRLTPDLCVGFLDAWQEDLDRWTLMSQRIRPVRSVGHALERLGLGAWAQSS
jgi:hypothetical protein